ncbi:MAG: helix-turn-helix domain-containing protein [Kiritimatiellia bacterium]|jgi:transcriptional regulator with XRE-family HTH domain|nr:helix-turn-helix domain-containing protein [Kiritimatiellia bacterium]
MAFGEILKNARLQRGLTPSDVAESTHLLAQVVEDLEREQFSRVAAPIYGRGFIKLYAELLELDPEPLIREFMDLYTGARAPAIRTRSVPQEAGRGAEAADADADAPRQAPEAAPQRQRIEPRPAVMVRPVVEAPDASAPSAGDAGGGAARSGTEEDPVAEREAHPARHGARDLFGWVVRPEEEGETDAPQEPDLFHPAPSAVPQLPDAAGAAERTGAGRAAVARRRALPIFKIGGRLSDRALAGSLDEDAEAHARRCARIQAFKEGFMKLRADVGRRLPATLPQKNVLMLAGAGVVVLICLLAGISLLFRLTGSEVRESPAPVFETVSPPPDLYID